MRRFILSVVLLGFVSGVWVSCSTNTERRAANDTAFAQTEKSGEQISKNVEQISNDNKKIYLGYLNLPIEQMIDGEKLEDVDAKLHEPMSIAVQSFKDDNQIPPQKKEIRRYKLEFRQDDQYYIVSMVVKRDPGKHYIGGETEYGKDATFFINKKDKSVQRIFHK